MKNNQFYNSKNFQLVKVKYNEISEPYTYAAYKSIGIEKGDLVVVPVGANQDMFSDEWSMNSLTIAKVVAVTNNMKNIPNEYEIKHVVCKVTHEVYDKLLTHKKNFNN